MKHAIDRFNEKIDKQNDCWIWTAQIYPMGYGAFSLNGKNISAHRASYILFKGVIPKGMFVCHRCDNRSCVNPEHLFIGSAKDNAVDRDSKGRGYKQPSKVSKNDKEKIFDLYQKHNRQRDIAEQFNISQRSVWRYIRKKIPSKTLKGEDNSNSRLNNEDVLQIRKMYIPYRMSYQKIADKYGVEVSTIYRIIKRETWQHI